MQFGLCDECVKLFNFSIVYTVCNFYHQHGNNVSNIKTMIYRKRFAIEWKVMKTAKVPLQTFCPIQYTTSPRWTCTGFVGWKPKPTISCTILEYICDSRQFMCVNFQLIKLLAYFLENHSQREWLCRTFCWRITLLWFYHDKIS